MPLDTYAKKILEAKSDELQQRLTPTQHLISIKIMDIIMKYIIYGNNINYEDTIRACEAVIEYAELCSQLQTEGH